MIHYRYIHTDKGLIKMVNFICTSPNFNSIEKWEREISDTALESCVIYSLFYLGVNIQTLINAKLEFTVQNARDYTDQIMSSIRK